MTTHAAYIYISSAAMASLPSKLKVSCMHASATVYQFRQTNI